VLNYEKGRGGIDSEASAMSFFEMALRCLDCARDRVMRSQ